MALPSSYLEINLARSPFGDNEDLYLAVLDTFERIVRWQAHLILRASTGTVTPNLSQADLEVESGQTHFHPNLTIQTQHSWANSGTNVIDGPLTIAGSYVESGTTYIREIVE